MVVTFFLLNGLVKVGESLTSKFTFISRMLDRYQFYTFMLTYFVVIMLCQNSL